MLRCAYGRVFGNMEAGVFKTQKTLDRLIKERQQPLHGGECLRASVLQTGTVNSEVQTAVTPVQREKGRRAESGPRSFFKRKPRSHHHKPCRSVSYLNSECVTPCVFLYA